MDLAWETPVRDESTQSTIRPTFAISVDGQLYKGLYLGAEFGTHSYLYDIDFSYKQAFDAAFTSTTSYKGSFKQEQVYFTINPQYRFGYHEFFGVGGGIGIYNNSVNTFNRGTASTQSTNPQFTGSSYKLDGQDYGEPNTTFGGFVNAIVNPKLENIGFIFEMRYIFNAYPKRLLPTNAKPDIKFNSFAVLVGLSFHF
jgi:hypothetical protein